VRGLDSRIKEAHPIALQGILGVRFAKQARMGVAAYRSDSPKKGSFAATDLVLAGHSGSRQVEGREQGIAAHPHQIAPGLPGVKAGVKVFLDTPQ
jgi:hypothetical protein